MAGTIDTLRIAKRFREARDDDERAEAFAAGLRKVQEGQLGDLVTKPEFRTGLAELRNEFKLESADLRSELRAEIVELRTETAAMRTELKTEIADLRGELRAGLVDVRGEIARANNRLLLWFVPLLLGQLGAMLWLVVRRDLGLG